MKKIALCFIILAFLSCKKSEETHKIVKQTPTSEKIEDTITIEEQEYVKFIPDSISGVAVKGFKIDSSYKIGNSKIVVGIYESIDGEMTYPDTEKDWGDRLLVLNDKNQITYKSKGVGETYLYEPYFYKNKSNNKIIIVCQRAYEYFFGGDAFLLENDKIKYIGDIDVEGKFDEDKLVDILKIKETKDKITFTFDSDSIILEPGSKDIYVKNNNIRYEYNNKSFKFIK